MFICEKRLTPQTISRFRQEGTTAESEILFTEVTTLPIDLYIENKEFCDVIERYESMLSDYFKHRGLTISFNSEFVRKNYPQTQNVAIFRVGFRFVWKGLNNFNK